MATSNKQSPAASPGSHLGILPPSTGSYQTTSPGWLGTANRWPHATGTGQRNASGSSNGAPESIASEAWTSRSASGTWSDEATGATNIDGRPILYPTGPRQASSARGTQFSARQLGPIASAQPHQRRSSQPISVNSGGGGQIALPHRSSSGSVLNASTPNRPTHMDGTTFIQQTTQVPPPVQFPTLSPDQTNHVRGTIHPRTSYGEFPMQNMASSVPTQQQHRYPIPDPALYSSPGLATLTGTPGMIPATPHLYHPAGPNAVHGGHPSSAHGQPADVWTHAMMYGQPPIGFPSVYHFAPNGSMMSPVVAHSPQIAFMPSPVMPHPPARAHTHMGPRRNVATNNGGGTAPILSHNHNHKQRPAPNLNTAMRVQTINIPAPVSMTMPMPLSGPYASYPNSPITMMTPSGPLHMPIHMQMLSPQGPHFHHSSPQVQRRGQPPRGQQQQHGYQHQQHPGHHRPIEHPEQQVVRSQLLEDFRNNKTRRWELKDIVGHVYEFSADQHGSRFIQQKIETAHAEDREMIYQEIIPEHALELMSHVFGNYVIQKLIEHGSIPEKHQLFDIMQGHVLEMSNNTYGCRVVQRSIEYMSAEQQGDIISELELHVGECARNQHGNHVIQKLIEHADPNRLSFIKEFRGQVRELCSHPYGCRVLQRCLEHLDEEQTRPLMDELHQHSLELMQDQFGNYVIQYVLEQGEPADRDRIIRNLRGHLLDMSCHKYSSNVCEKALLQAAPADLQVLVDEILVTRVDGGTFVPRMIKDQYANYVLQRAMRVVDGDVQARLWRELRKVMPHMRKFSAAPAKHITNVQRILDQHPDV